MFLKQIRQTIFKIFFLLGLFIILIPAARASVNGEGCSLAPFEMGDSIVPERFRDPANIVTVLGKCDILQIVSNVIGLAYILIFPIIGIAIAIGGFFLLIAGGDEKSIKKGKGIIKSALIGAAISLGAGIIVSSVMAALGVENSLMPWLF